MTEKAPGNLPAIVGELVTATREYLDAIRRKYREEAGLLRFVDLPEKPVTENLTRVAVPGARESILAAATAERAVNQILRNMGARTRNVENAMNELVLPARLVAIMVHLQRMPPDSLQQDVRSAAQRLYRRFYADSIVVTALGQLEGLELLARQDVGRTRPATLGPWGKEALQLGKLGPRFKIFETAFAALSKTDQIELCQTLEQVVYHKGKAPDILNPLTVQAYANIGLADHMAFPIRNALDSFTAAQILTLRSHDVGIPLSELRQELGPAVGNERHREKSQKFGVAYRMEGQHFVVSLTDVSKQVVEELLSNPVQPSGFEITPFLAAVNGLGAEKARRLAGHLTKVAHGIPPLPAG